MARLWAALRERLDRIPPPRIVPPRRAAHPVYLVLIPYLCVVVLVASRHEFFRDEVRALSIVVASHSFTDLFHRLHNEGHPALWYTVLYGGYRLSHSLFVLPVATATIAFLAAGVFLARAPFRLWDKLLFPFGVLPVYEYAVVSRSYGLAMLLFFLLGVVYLRRYRQPWLVGLVLMLLANTSGYLSPIVLAISSGLFLSMAFGSDPRRSVKAALICAVAGALGVAFAVWTAWPDKTSVATPVHQLTPQQIVAAVKNNLAHPGMLLCGVFGDESDGRRFSPLIWLLAALLLGRGALFYIFIVGSIGMALMFSVIYGSCDLRHHGIYLLFILWILWVDRIDLWRAPFRAARPLAWIHGKVRGLLLTALLIDQAHFGYRFAKWDFQTEASSCKALGTYLHAHPELADAIIMGEPDYLLEALPYYAKNMIYIPRERRYSDTVSFTTANKEDLSLIELLKIARQVKARSQRTVLIAIGDELTLTPDAPRERSFSYGKTFRFDPASLDVFNEATEKLIVLDSADSDENFTIYRLK